MKKPEVLSGRTRNILLTGMWPPTNDMIRQFSDDPGKNPQGWSGRDWHGRGYDIFACFPEFPDYAASTLEGTGEFQIDYRRVSSDFWRIVADTQPCAIVTFSAMAGTYPCWAVERYARNLDTWKLRAHVTEQPDPVPPDRHYAPNAARESTLPMNAIVAAVIESKIYDAVSNATQPCAIIREDAGAFVSEFIAYHGMWYQSRNSDATSAHRCIAAGHIHVGTEAAWSGDQRFPVGPTAPGYADALRRAKMATEVTLDQVINLLESVT